MEGNVPVVKIDFEPQSCKMNPRGLPEPAPVSAFTSTKEDLKLQARILSSLLNPKLRQANLRQVGTASKPHAQNGVNFNIRQVKGEPARQKVPSGLNRSDRGPQALVKFSPNLEGRILKFLDEKSIGLCSSPFEVQKRMVTEGVSQMSTKFGRIHTPVSYTHLTLPTIYSV
eukprot:TRINITY_DN8858_c0_g1_i1.p1 TRINITY_DN8858_c0_g1~~TRINITY_DN8858_c0_g1_i1.p1  ORF type:complete len:171 (-),score=10.44 TRINITY_DN8858_c0_g1_i1:34-546(-)